MIKGGVIGATGYAGQELVRLLLQHEECEIVSLGSRSYTGKDYSSIYGNYNGLIEQDCSSDTIAELAEKADIIFLALPHGIASNQINEEILSKTKIVDLGADYRLTDVNVYEKWYGVTHGSEELLKDAVYGLCELKRADIKGASLVANPGCYTTCSILSLYPLVKEKMIDLSSIIIDAKSGVSGAGRTLTIGSLYTECSENIKAYKIGSHRHTPEIEQELSLAADEEITILFTPHLTPMIRGILITAYANLNKEYSSEEIKAVYDKYYQDEYFIRVLGEELSPEPKWVKGSNYCDIGFKIDKRTNRIVVNGAIDNLIKGAAGQAVQNMNILFGFEETKGLKQIPIFPA